MRLPTWEEVQRTEDIKREYAAKKYREEEVNRSIWQLVFWATVIGFLIWLTSGPSAGCNPDSFYCAVTPMYGGEAPRTTV